MNGFFQRGVLVAFKLLHHAIVQLKTIGPPTVWLIKDLF